MLLRLIGSATAADLRETLPVRAPPICAAYDRFLAAAPRCDATGEGAWPASL